jgi:hypothetical protein
LVQIGAVTDAAPDAETEPNGWPALPFDGWRDTCSTLHMYAQVVGKLRLALSPFEPEWANVPLYVTARGLTTSPMPVGARTIDAEFDLVDHVLVVRGSDGSIDRRPLGGTVADFYEDVTAMLARMRVDVAISIVPSEVPDPIPFPDDRTHDTYDATQVDRFRQVLTRVDVAMKEHRARFRGRTTPVHFFWGTFDLALTRYSGRPATVAPDAGLIRRVSGDAEQICCGWWPGSDRIPYPAFFSYAHPRPDGIEAVPAGPGGWDPEAGEFLLPYDAVRSAPDPPRAIRDFLHSTYAGAAELLHWDRDLTNVTAPAPTGGGPSRLGGGR